MQCHNCTEAAYIYIYTYNHTYIYIVWSRGGKTTQTKCPSILALMLWRPRPSGPSGDVQRNLLQHLDLSGGTPGPGASWKIESLKSILPLLCLPPSPAPSHKLPVFEAAREEPRRVPDLLTRSMMHRPEPPNCDGRTARLSEGPQRCKRPCPSNLKMYGSVTGWPKGRLSKNDIHQ